MLSNDICSICLYRPLLLTRGTLLRHVALGLFLAGLIVRLLNKSMHAEQHSASPVMVVVPLAATLCRNPISVTTLLSCVSSSSSRQGTIRKVP